MQVECGPEDPIRHRLKEALDAVDRSEMRNRFLVCGFVAGCLGLAMWFDRALQSSLMPIAAALECSIVSLVGMLALVAITTHQAMNKHTHMILRAIAQSPGEAAKSR
jgi:hypothetical protein